MGGDLEYRYELTHYSKPWTFNAERAFRHWSERSQATQEWRHAFKMLAKEARVPAMERVRIEVHHLHKPIGKRPWPDPVACAGAAKAAIDGVVDAGVLPDDNGKYLQSVEFFAPEESNKDGLVLVLEDLSNCADD
jgi:hypothetical protein